MQILSVITNVILIFKYTDGVVWELYSLSFVLLVNSARPFAVLYRVAHPPMALPAGVESGVFSAASGWQDFSFSLFTALTVWGGGLCLAKLDTDAAARRKQPGLP